MTGNDITSIMLDEKWDATNLFEQARKAVQWHRAEAARVLKALDDCLAGVE